jgi:hypothetical protein
MMRQTILKTSRAILGWPPRPASHLVKRAAVTRHAHQWKLENFIETGTFEGDMVEAQRAVFKKIISIELDNRLAAAAQCRFAACPHIQILNGDSATMLAEAMRLIPDAALFWLDAHYSGGVTARGELETPIMQELSLIAEQRQGNDVILIDDARLFGLRRGYPKLATVKKFIAAHLPACACKVEADAICIIPPLP